ncbi:MAG TPA: DinB family protein [Hymenobacter sp.]|jgi:uncharacterized damage-inducible protein DinB
MVNTNEKLAIYNVWANETLLRHLDKTVAQTGQPIPAPILRLFSHVLNAQFIWVGRLTNTPSPVKVWQEHPLEELHRMHEQTSAQWVGIVRAADEAELNRTISYTNSAGDAFTSVVSDIFTHMPVHANYHRAQVAIKMREAGLEPINTDFITYCREMDAQGKDHMSL